MPQQYYLDIAYQSDISVVDTTKPISMAYGFVQQISGGYQGKGEKVDQRINVGDLVGFAIYDTASNPSPISSVVITCEDVTNPNSKTGMDPFGWSTPGTFTSPNTGLSSGGTSTGCNMYGYYLIVGNFTSQSKGQGKGQKKTYDITITVTLQNGRVFQVDPDMDVEGVN